MFTGIVAGTGRIGATTLDGELMTMRVDTDLAAGAPKGASIAVDGVCLTVVDEGGAGPQSFTVEVIGETLNRTVLGTHSEGSRVNIELGMPAGARLDGHIVTGHVDAVGHVRSVQVRDGWTVLTVGVPDELAAGIVEKGSITLNGVSLTIMGVSEPDAPAHWLSVGLIPETLAVTNLGDLTEGSPVNLETDIIGKYVERITAVRKAQS